jgi:hypothetical protein
MFAGGKLGVAFGFAEMMAVIIVGNLLLGLYAAGLGYIAFKSGLNSVLMGRFCFGEVGSKLSDLILGFTQIGWYAWGTATAAVVIGKYFDLNEGTVLGLMVLFGLMFCATAYVGYRGLEILSYIAVPAMMLLLMLSMWVATVKVGGFEGLLSVVPSGSLDWSTAITLVFGTFVSGATQATNWTRFSRSARVAVLASLIGFFIGNGLMVLIGAYGAIVYQQPDVVEVLLLQGFAMAAMAMLLLNIWSTQDNTIYNFAVAGCNLLRTGRRKTVTPRRCGDRHAAGLARHVRHAGAVSDSARHSDSADWRGDHGRLLLPLARALSASGRRTVAGVQLAGARGLYGRHRRRVQLAVGRAAGRDRRCRANVCHRYRHARRSQRDRATTRPIKKDSPDAHHQRPFAQPGRFARIAP